MRFSASHRIALVVALATLIAAAGGFSTILRAARIQLTKLPIHPESGMTFPSLPAQTASWERFGPERPPLSTEILDELGTENYISRLYTRKSAEQSETPIRLDLHCAYYTGTIDTVPHIPERCFVGGGLSQAGASTTIPVPLDMAKLSPDPTVDPEEVGGTIYRARLPDGGRVRLPLGIDRLAMRITPFLDPQGNRFFSGYFFIANGGVVASAEQVRSLAFRLTDTHAYYAKVQVTSASVSSPEELAAQTADLLDEMLPHIMRRVPDWINATRAQRNQRQNDSNEPGNTIGARLAPAGGLLHHG